MVPVGSMNVVGEVLVNRLGLMVEPDWVTESMAEVTEMHGCIWY
jgi:G:T-mismatch repair DNA endonuclease (very short patch repair protein)